MENTVSFLNELNYYNFVYNRFVLISVGLLLGHSPALGASNIILKPVLDALFMESVPTG